MAQGHTNEIRLIPKTDISLDQEPVSRSRVGVNGSKVGLNHMQSSNSHTLEPQPSTATHIKFQPQHNRVTSEGPGVGSYELSSSLIKPAFETYQKNKEVILVKINHIGGTSSFKNQQERFEEGQSIYESSLTPGPGSYQAESSKKLRRIVEERSPAYEAVQQIMRSKREKVGSTPSYILGDKAEHLQYNGLPRHLQDMYLKLKQQSDDKTQKSAQKEQHAVRFKKRIEKYPIKINKTIGHGGLEGATRYQPTPQPPPKETNNNTMTETMMRLSRERELEKSKMRKIRMILNDRRGRKGELSVDFGLERRAVRDAGRQIRQGFNRNMVNILYGHKT